MRFPQAQTLLWENRSTAGISICVYVYTTPHRKDAHQTVQELTRLLRHPGEWILSTDAYTLATSLSERGGNEYFDPWATVQ